MKTPKVRTGQGSTDLKKAEFLARGKELFRSPRFDSVEGPVNEVLAQLWKIYDESEKSPYTVKAGAEFKKPNHELDVEWLNTHHRLKAAKKIHDTEGTKPYFLVINASPRSDNTCPSEMSKTHRLCQAALKVLNGRKFETRYLDLSRITSEYGVTIHPCKGCVSTAMPLCHWPCSCYPNQALGQVHDWMNDIYEYWTRAHGVMIITPVHWYSPTSVLKLMMDRLVCSDGGNPDPTTTEGKNAKLAKQIELKGWDYPKHLKGRVFSIVTHGDAEGTYPVKAVLNSWLKDLGLISAGNQAELDRFIGYYEPYATSHDALDEDQALFKEVQNAANLLKHKVLEIMGRKNNEAETSEETAVRSK